MKMCPDAGTQRGGMYASTCKNLLASNGSIDRAARVDRLVEWKSCSIRFCRAEFRLAQHHACASCQRLEPTDLRHERG